MSRRSLFLFLFAWIVFLVSFVQAQRFNITHYNTRDGLSQSQVTVILQDDEGYMWFGTRDGISRFDGRKFTLYTKGKDLSGTDVATGLRDSQGNLWFGFVNGTISIFNKDTRKFVEFKLSAKNGQLCPIIRIREDAGGVIWIATNGCGIFIYDGDTTRHISEGLVSTIVIDFCQIGEDLIALIGDKGFNVYERSSFLQGEVKRQRISLDAKIDPTEIRSCYVYPDYNQAWLGKKNNGVYLVDLKSGKIKKHLSRKNGIVPGRIERIYRDSDGAFWFISRFGQFSRYDPAARDNSVWTPDAMNGLSEKRVWTVFQDREKNYWMGTDGGGVIKFRDKSILILKKSDGLSGNSVWDIIKTKNGDLWIATNKGLSRIYKNGSETKIENYTSFVQPTLNYVGYIYEDKKGDVWFHASDSGVFKWRRSDKKIIPVHLPEYFNKAYAGQFVEDEKGNFWFISILNDGLLKYDIKTRTYQHLTQKKDAILSDKFRFLYKDKENSIWFATDLHGIMRLKDGKWTYYSKKEGCPIFTATSMTEDDDGNYWFVTLQNQLFKFDGKKFENLTTEKGLHGSGLYSIIADGNTIWIGTTQGIARYNQADSSFTHYGYKEGYPINETNEGAVYKDEDGYLWFGTIDGAVGFNPQKAVKNTVEPKIVITDLQVFYKDIPFPPNNQFTYDNNHLTFYFTGLSFTKPELVRYKYKLEGFDSDWSPPTDISKATYSNLPSGKYTFKVKACNGEGYWSRSPAVYSFEIETPFWATWWFTGLIIIIISLVIFMVVKMRIRSIERQRRSLEQKVRERTKELQREKEEVEKAMKALHESETKFRSYTQLASSAIYIHQDDRFKFVNKAGITISGYSLEQLLNMNIWDLVHPDDFDMVMGNFRTRLTGGKVPEQYEFRIITKQKEVRWLDFSGRIIEYEGKPAVLATGFDITERKTVEKALLEEKERLDVTLSSIGDGVITTSIDGKIAIFNKIAEKVTGWSQQEAKGKPIEEVLTIRSAENGSTLINPVQELQNGGAVKIEDRIAFLQQRGGHTQRIINYNSVPLKDQNSNVIGAVIAFRDITEKRQMEEELFKAQKLESIGLLAGGIAHDFNNILTAIMGNISLAKMHQETSDKVVDLLDKAEKATSRAQDLTQQLLTFSKGGTPLLKTSSVESIIEESVDFVLKGSNVKCVFNVEDDIKAVEIDEGQISQVIQNLVINADQAMPDGGNINISVKNVHIKKNNPLALKPGEYVKIDVNDDGIGIQKEHLVKIFDPFFSTKQSGSGLGLATSYSILQKHKGLLAVASEIGKGSTFSIYLPASDKKREKIQSEVVESNQFMGEGRILIMDDDEMILETSRALLGHLGFKVDSARTGEEALEKYQRIFTKGGKYDLVIMDLTIPGGMGGKMAIEKLLEMDPDAVAVVSSGYSTDPIMADFQKYGFKGRLKKPFNMKEILEMLENFNLIRVKN